jgi:S1-C subfamily serine protease
VNPPRLLALFGAAAIALSGCSAGGSAIFGQPEPTTTGPAVSPQTPPPSLPPLTGSNRIVRVVRRVSPAVVNVRAAVGDGQEGEGTGFFVRPDGIAVTNDHVVRGAFSIDVVTADGGKFEARVIGGDPGADLAVLRVEGGGPFPTVPLGESGSLRLGQSVVALGFALGLEGGPSVTSGIVSALGRTISATDPNAPGGQGARQYEGLIQTDAAINPGNSGGPLVDLGGRVVGINTAGVGAAAAENIGFAIAIDRARPVVEHAIENPEAPAAYLGVSTQTVTPAVAAGFSLSVDEGALVRAVGPGTPADEAGIREGDVIVGIGGTSVSSTEEVGERILEFDPGTEVEVELVRGQDTLTVTATLGTRPQPIEG